MNNCTINTSHSNCLAYDLDKVGRALTYPMCRLFFEQVGKVICPIIPGHRDQAGTKCAEIACRIVRAVFCILILPLVPIGWVGGILRTIASLARREFIAVRPSRDFQPRIIQKLTIATFNASWLPPVANIVFRNYSPARERVEAAATGARGSEADIICLQEAFNTEVTDEFVSRIKNVYPYVIFNAGFSSLKLNSGLLIATYNIPVT